MEEGGGAKEPAGILGSGRRPERTQGAKESVGVHYNWTTKHKWRSSLVRGWRRGQGRSQTTGGFMCHSNEFKFLIGRTILGFKAGGDMAQFAFWKGDSGINKNWLREAREVG